MVSLSKPNKISYSTVGLTRDQRRILATLPESHRPSFVRNCRKTGVLPV